MLSLFDIRRLVLLRGCEVLCAYSLTDGMIYRPSLEEINGRIVQDSLFSHIIFPFPRRNVL